VNIDLQKEGQTLFPITISGLEEDKYFILFEFLDGIPYKKSWIKKRKMNCCVPQ
jgi:hypothetical protein